MTYMLLIYGTQTDREPSPEEWDGMLRAYEAYTERVKREGVFVDAAPLAPTSSATTVRVRDGNRVITDGPFAETKEWLGGFYMIECDSLDKAIELAAACPGAAIGSVEIRPVRDLSG